MQHRVDTLTAVQLAALLFIALALVPAGAHLFEFLNKMSLPPEQYMVVQKIYRGWALFGIVIFGALISALVHSYLVRRNGQALLWSALAFLAIVATQVIFWAFTYPMNALTQNWTVTPVDLEAARRQWEYSHAVNAGITFLALISICLSVLASRPTPRLAPPGPPSPGVAE